MPVYTIKRIGVLPAFIYITLAVITFSCAEKNHDKAGVEAAMQYYDHLILKLDADSIALLYTKDGNLGDIAIGRDSIRHFLSSFENVKVLSQISKTSSISITADTAIQKGTYQQKDLVYGKDTASVKGEYTARWEWVDKAGWRIKKMETKAVK